MGAFISFPPPTRWSSCSVDDLNGLIAEGGDICLFNQPTTIVGDPVCGNEFVEDGEICDCGTPEECTDMCCNATTCQLADGAQCVSGECCDQCQFNSPETVCRIAAGECDITDFCSGSSGQCPIDDVRADRSDCSGGTGACLNGVCLTRDSQCRVSFSKSHQPEHHTRILSVSFLILIDTTSDTRCFDRNIDGDIFGNCGHNTTNFISCAPRLD